jgi:aminobenzoyl-glutamate transport protein
VQTSGVTRSNPCGAVVGRAVGWSLQCRSPGKEIAMAVAVAPPEGEGEKRGTQRLLDRIERVGNKVPHPAIMFVALCMFVIVVSAILALANVKVTTEVVSPPPPASADSNYPYYPGGSVVPNLPTIPNQPAATEYVPHVETIAVKNLLNASGIRFIFTSFVENFNNFSAVGVIIIAMIGVGLAEEAGLIGALIRRIVKVAPQSTLTFIIVLAGMISSVASDAGYLVLVPLGAVVFRSIGRNPVAGIAAAFAGVSAGFGVNFLITPVDGIVTEITNESIHLVDPNKTISVTHNLYWGIGATIFVTIVITMVAELWVGRQLGQFDESEMSHEASASVEDLSPEARAAEARGLRMALWGFLGVLAVILVALLPPGAPLRNPDTGALFADSPFMDSLIVIIMLIFLVSGWAYGRGAGTITTTDGAMAAITKSLSGLGGLIFIFVLIAQFLAYFNYSNIAQVIAVQLSDVLEQADIPIPLLLVGLVLLVFIVDILLPGVIPKWSILAPIFIPLFLRLGVGPATVIAGYRVGDGPVNVVTPLMVYLAFVVLQVQRWRKSAGIGTVVAMMLPYTLVLIVTWTAFYILWYVIGIPWGPNSPVHV